MKTLNLCLGIAWLLGSYSAASAVADRFDYPIGNRDRYTEANDGDGWHVAQEFGDWNSDYSKYHLGEDWNAESGGNTDCGLPVYAVANGTIVYANIATGWGRVLIVRHTLPDGSQMESLYGHLASFAKTSGDVECGDQIGAIGDGSEGGTTYSCHLHLELRTAACTNWGQPGAGYSVTSKPEGWTDPSDFIDANRSGTSRTIFYVSNSSNGSISAVAADGSVSTFATGLPYNPNFLAFDKWGNLYASAWGTGDGLVGTIQKVTPDGHVSTWSAGFQQPSGLAFDSAGNLYVSCNGYATTGFAIVRITPGGSASIFSTAVHNPSGLAFDKSGNLFAADYWDHTISKITPDGTVSTFASGFSGRLTGLAFDSVGNLYAVNLDGYVIQKITPEGSISSFATGQTWPGSLAFDQSGNLYLADYIANRVERVGPDGGSVSTFATGFSNPNGIAMAPPGPRIVTPPQSRTVQAGSTVTFS
ncbi:MAG: peptidoglycan DD-metalloendopeptidase family protein, partial [Verrucomicrobia bacterium]|nr:peptidoglycan DD-metalloendopeptidase family protein [Verrucomicrobiota bacterium]